MVLVLALTLACLKKVLTSPFVKKMEIFVQYYYWMKNVLGINPLLIFHFIVLWYCCCHNATILLYYCSIQSYPQCLRFLCLRFLILLLEKKLITSVILDTYIRSSFCQFCWLMYVLTRFPYLYIWYPFSLERAAFCFTNHSQKKPFNLDLLHNVTWNNVWSEN